MVLLEKKVPFEFHNVDLTKGEQKTADVKAKQPFGQVPYIVRAKLICIAVRPLILERRMMTVLLFTKVEPLVVIWKQSIPTKERSLFPPVFKSARYSNKQLPSNRRTLRPSLHPLHTSLSSRSESFALGNHSYPT
jgi:hypothetical protein